MLKPLLMSIGSCMMWQLQEKKKNTSDLLLSIQVSGLIPERNRMIRNREKDDWQESRDTFFLVRCWWFIGGLHRDWMFSSQRIFDWYKESFNKYYKMLLIPALKHFTISPLLISYKFHIFTDDVTHLYTQVVVHLQSLLPSPLSASPICWAGCRASPVSYFKALLHPDVYSSVCQLCSFPQTPGAPVTLVCGLIGHR